MDSASTAASDTSLTFPSGAGSGLELWDLIVIGSQVAGIEAALDAADFRGRIGLVEQRAGADASATEPASTYQLVRSRLQQAVRCAAQSGHPVPWPFAAPGIPPAAPATSDPPRQAAPHVTASRRFRIERLPGWAVFTGPHTLAIHGREVAFHRAILASGGRYVATEVPGLIETGFATAESLHTLARQPRQIAILGSGSRACELAQALRRLGSEVTLVAEKAGPLDDAEPLACQALLHSLDADGVRLHLGFRATNAEVAGRAKALVIERNGVRHKLLVDEIVLAGDRRANLDRLGLEAAGIRVAGNNAAATVKVDARLATTNARVFAVGEVAAHECYPEALDRMCHTAIQNAIGSARQRFDPSLVPRLMVTDPAIAQIGLTASEAQSRGVEADSWFLRLDMVSVAPQRFDPQSNPLLLDSAESTGGLAIVHTLRDVTGRVVGATLVGPHAIEGIGTVALLMAEELPLAALSRPVTPAGTFARALAHLGTAIERANRAGRRRAR